MTEASDFVPPGESNIVTNVTQQPIHDIAANESGRHQTGEVSESRAEPAEGGSLQSAPGIPSWGSGPTTSESEPALDSREDWMDTGDVEIQSPAGNAAIPTQDKGKGKAMTVEDSTEDVD